MRLRPRNEIERDLLRRNQASTWTLRYRLWHTYASDTRPSSAYPFRNESIHSEITGALRVIQNIQAWHPAWLSSYIDFDKDIYTSCMNQSKKVIDALHEYQQNPEAGPQYRDALADLKMLSELAAQRNVENSVSRVLLVCSTAMMLGLYLVFPTQIMTALGALVFLIPLILLMFLSIFLNVCVNLWDVAEIFSFLNIAVLAAVSIGIAGTLMNIMNPSPQGSIRLAHALNNLINACERHCPVPELIDDARSENSSVYSR